jgi:hypothetical protein
MTLSNSLVSALVAVLISPTIAGSATHDLTFSTEEASPSTSMYDLVQKHGKNKNLGKLTETSVTVFIATDEDSEEADSLALAFLEDDLLYAYNKVQAGKGDLEKGSGLQGVRSHYLGKATPSGDPEGDVLFPELSKSSRGSVGSWRYTG